eukprot:TRINITY_DN15170_c0_g1_i1.p1 TRINITY_DN15170_c0_g1~~TRINITY_DN15170_c0_g1_i1.p1  ORF type:complete len:143 (-),score=22.63 TRINITY_DN15170_c0_g1_i1:62-490(-)
MKKTTDFTPILAHGSFMNLKQLCLSLEGSYIAFFQVAAKNPWIFPSLERLQVPALYLQGGRDHPPLLLQWLEARATANVSPLIEFSGSLSLETLQRLQRIYGSTITKLSLGQQLERMSSSWLLEIVKFENLYILCLPSLDIR